ncbi:MAG: rod shape-determining protein MreC [Chloroflexi bacterium]|nr:rod shape-determining protein MreC [Chloroflexota bacterium]MDA8189277.1 rod shape-determining protein MreC [Dehalococcoidales bacterium]
MFTRLAPLLLIISIGLAGILSFRTPQLRFVQDIAVQVFAPVQWALSGPSAGVAEFFQNFQGISDLRAENARLREEVDRLTQETVRLPELERENQELLAQLNLKRSQPTYQWITAKVIYYDPSNLVQSLTINRGSKDGLREGMTVITPAALVGRITRVSPATARVLLITDASSSVTAMIQSSRTKGVVNGQRREFLKMKYIPQSETVRTGDKVITSGVGGVFPEGILIGSVTNVSKKDTDIFQEADIEPGANLASLDTVLVIINHMPVTLD